MIPNIHQSIDEIINVSSPAQKIMWQQIRLIAGENAAVQQFYFIGATAGTIFTTYAAGRIWVAYEMEFGTVASAGAATGYAQFFNENNVNSFFLRNESVTYNGTTAAINYHASNLKTTNFYFSRFFTGYTHMMLNGFKIQY